MTPYGHFRTMVTTTSKRAREVSKSPITIRARNSNHRKTEDKPNSPRERRYLAWLIRLMAAIIKMQLSRVSPLFASKFDIQRRFKLAKDTFQPFIQRILYGKQESQRPNEIILHKTRSKRGRKFTRLKN